VTLWSIAASLLAALFYGVAAVYTRVRAQGAQPQGLALYSQLFAALLLVPAVPFTLPSAWPSVTVIVSVVLLALLSTAVGYRLYFYLIVSAGATKATMVTYLSPAFGMLWGSLFLQEQLAPAFLLGFLLILGSVVLVSSDPKRGALRHGTANLDG
jgi:drug/metabolite transporter (DMT)-like permease